MEHVEGVPEYKFHNAKRMSCFKRTELIELDFDEMYDKFSNLAYGLAYERLQDSYTVEDIVQEVFIRLSKEIQIRSFYEENHVKSWVLRTTANLCIDKSRRRDIEENGRRKLQNQYETSSLEDVLDRMIEEKEAQERVNLVFCKLKKKNRRWYKVAMDYYSGSKTMGQLAEELNLTYAGMCMLMKRIRTWIGSELFHYNPDLRKLYPEEYEQLKIQNRGKNTGKKKNTLN